MHSKGILFFGSCTPSLQDSFSLSVECCFTLAFCSWWVMSVPLILLVHEVALSTCDEDIVERQDSLETIFCHTISDFCPWWGPPFGVIFWCLVWESTISTIELYDPTFSYFLMNLQAAINSKVMKSLYFKYQKSPESCTVQMFNFNIQTCMLY